MSTQTPTKRPPVKSADLETLKQQQLDAIQSDDGRGDIEHVKGNTAAAGDYELPANTGHLVHLRLTKSVANELTQQFDKTETSDAFSPAEFERMEKNDSFREYQKVEIVHDPRPKARQLADKTGDVPTGSPAEANKSLASLNDAQMRYKELTKEDAPTNVSYEELVALVLAIEAKLKADSSTPAGAHRTLRSTEDAQVRYKELVGYDAPAEKKFAELKEAIAHLEKPENAADLAAFKAEHAAQ